MKVMALNRNIGTPINEIMSVDMIPDSAIIRDRKPFFVPDFSSNWIARPVIAFRIHRLGKNIAEKFASRYYDAFTLGVRMIPADLLSRLESNGMATGLATAFDGAFIHGEWIPTSGTENLPLDINIEGLNVTINRQETEIDKTIELLSRFYTFKIGDIVIPGLLPTERSVTINTSISGKINGTECINFRIK